MKFTINRLPFLEQLTNVGRAVSGKATIPILQGIKISVEEDKITLTGSDSEISIESTLYVKDETYHIQIEETGSIVLTARLFSDIVRKLPTGQVTIESNAQNQTLITSGKAHFTLIGQDGSAYPRLPDYSEEFRLIIPTIPFKNMVNQTIFSASNQESRPVLTGLHLVAEEGFIRGVATDSHRLSQRDVSMTETKEELGFDQLTIPKKSVVELTRIVKDDQIIEMLVLDKQIIFFVDNVIIYSRLLEGNYPETDRLIPTEYETRITVNSNTFHEAIDRASLISHQGKNNVVQLSFDNEIVSLYVRGNERGEGVEHIEVKAVEGSPTTIAFNPDYMKEALKSFEGVDIHIDIQSAIRPMLLSPATYEEDNEEEVEDAKHNSLLQILTPIRTH